jgi:CRP/FNR family cyclic AMP-dependent transcriptional regulator
MSSLVFGKGYGSFSPTAPALQNEPAFRPHLAHLHVALNGWDGTTPAPLVELSDQFYTSLLRRVDYIGVNSCETRPCCAVLPRRWNRGGKALSLETSVRYLRIWMVSPRNTAPKRGPGMTDMHGSKLLDVKFDITEFLAVAGLGRHLVCKAPREMFFVQGAMADSVYYLQSGRARLTVVSERGKEATITMLGPGDFIGEESIASVPGQRMASATAVTACAALQIDRAEMIRVMHEQHDFSDMFLAFLLARGMRTQADLVDQLFNNSEKRLARILLLMAEFGQPGEPEPLIPRITQETLAEMIGTTRSRVSFFMNKFRQHGFIDYNGRIRVHKSLLNVILYDQPNGANATAAELEEPKDRRKSRAAHDVPVAKA